MTLMQKKKRSKAVKLTVAAFITLLQIIPLAVVLLNSMRSNEEIGRQLVGVPTSFHFSNYVQAWVQGGYLQAYGNSLLIGIGSSVIVLLIVAFAVYGLTKMHCFFPRFFHTYFVAGLAVPTFAIIVPLFFFFYKVNLVNTHLGMILIYSAINISFNFMFMYAFFEGLPKELDEAARIAGAGEMQNFVYNVVPLAKPIFTSVLLIVFVNTWNEFLFSNTFLQQESMRTVSLKFYNFVGKSGSDFGFIYAAAIISILPIVVIYFLMQDSFVEGMTSGSVKG